MKKLISIFTLTLMSLTLALPSLAREIPMKFLRGSYCGSYGGPVKVGDTFVLGLAKEQQLIVKNRSGHGYSVIAPNGTPLKVIQTFPNQEYQYWTGNQSGNFRVRINSVPSNLQANIEFCAYTGEGAM